MNPRGRDRGSATSEMVLVVPVAVLLVCFVAFLGRAGETHTAIRHAADQGARAASMVALGRMDEEARRAVEEDLVRSGHRCRDTTVTVSVDSQGRSVTVSVECSVDIGGLENVVGAPRTVRGESTETIDRYRAD